MVRGGDIRDGIITNDQPFITPEKSREYARTELRERDVVIALVGYPGESAVVPPRLSGANISRAVGLLRPAASLLPEYLACYLNSPDGRAEFLKPSAGSAQIVVNLGALNRLRIPLPSLPEQRRIAATLDAVNALLDGLTRLIAKKRDLKQAAMQQLLTGLTRLPGFVAEWSIRRIGDVASIVAGGTPSTRIASYWGGTIRWMSSGELRLKRVNDVAGRITELGLRNSSAVMLPRYCVLIGLAGQGRTRGTAAINEVELCTNQSIAAVLPSPVFVPEFLFYNLESRYEEIREMSTGVGGRGALNLRIISSIQVRLPPINEQTAVANVLSDMDTELATLEGRRAKTQALKQAMMQELLTGRIRLVSRDPARA